MKELRTAQACGGRLSIAFRQSVALSFAAAVFFFICWIRAEPVFAQVGGVVLDYDNTPIAGAIVSVQGTEQRTVTDALGRFTLDDAVGTNLVIVAAAVGYYNAATTVSSPVAYFVMAVEEVPLADDPSYVLADPAECGSCHPDQLAQWTGSPMQKGGLNTWVHDIYSGTGTPTGMGGFVYLRDSAFAAHNPESECAACHQPEPWIENPFSALVDLGNVTPAVMHGISCEVCHKVAHIDETKLNFPGIYPGVVTHVRPEGPDYDQVQFGMLGDVSFDVRDEMRASYQPQLAAEVCAACHQDKNDPDEDGDFEEANGVISEPTYFEWDESPYADPESPYYATCVDCHMPPSGEDEVCNVLVPPLLRDPATIRSHRIEGTTPVYLENAVEMSMEAGRVGDNVEVDVTITNSLTGHHVPTGVTVRNMILLVEAWRDGDGMELAHTGSQVIHDLGGIGDPADGYYAGLAGKFFAKMNHDAMGNGPTFFTDATGITEDNRLAALASDATSYTFALPAGGGDINVRARLIYRRAFRFLVDAKQWTEDGHGNPLADVLPPHFGHLMEMSEQTVNAPSCLGQPAGTSCDDGNPCNGDESCDGFDSCVSGPPLMCDDGNVCTDDACDPLSGCVFSANSASCDDGSSCTFGDTCTGGVCVGAAVDCDDGNVCTDDSCVPATGCVHDDNAMPCDDGDACTDVDTCDAGVCVGGDAIVCDDGNACTQDSCDAGGGCVYASEPALDCRESASSRFRIVDKDRDERDMLQWAWLRGESTSQSDLGDPGTSTSYTLCVYDDRATGPVVATALPVPPGSAWRSKDPRGAVYRDPTGSSAGVELVRIRTGSSGRAAIRLDARGVNLPLPAAANPFDLFAQNPAVTVQLHNDATPACWTSRFEADGTVRNHAGMFRAHAR